MMNKPSKWEIWKANFVYDDNPNEMKNRPVLILVNVSNYPVLVAKITKHDVRINYPGEFRVNKWREAGLDYPSTIRLSKRLQLEEYDFTEYLGRLHPFDIIEVQRLVEEMR